MCINGVSIQYIRKSVRTDASFLSLLLSSARSRYAPNRKRKKCILKLWSLSVENYDSNVKNKMLIIEEPLYLIGSQKSVVTF